MASASKRKRERRAKARQRQRELRARKASFLWRWFWLLSPAWKFFAGAATFLSLVLAYYSFAPKINVYSAVPEADPWDCPFVIKNESLFAIHSLNFSYGVVKFDLDGGGSVESLSLVREELPVSELETNESTSVKIPRPTGQPMVRGDVVIRINYKAWFLPFWLKYEARFVTIRVTPKGFLWTPAAKAGLKTTIKS